MVLGGRGFRNPVTVLKSVTLEPGDTEVLFDCAAQAQDGLFPQQPVVICFELGRGVPTSGQPDIRNPMEFIIQHRTPEGGNMDRTFLFPGNGFFRGNSCICAMGDKNPNNDDRLQIVAKVPTDTKSREMVGDVSLVVYNGSIEDSYEGTYASAQVIANGDQNVWAQFYVNSYGRTGVNEAKIIIEERAGGTARLHGAYIIPSAYGGPVDGSAYQDDLFATNVPNIKIREEIFAAPYWVAWADFSTSAPSGGNAYASLTL